MTIKYKILIGTIAPLTLGLILLIFFTERFVESNKIGQLKKIRLDAEANVENKLKSQVNTVCTSISSMLASNISEEECLKTIKQVRSSASGYFWIHRYDQNSPENPIMIMHPTKPSLDGKSLAAVADDRTKKLSVNGVVLDSSVAEISSKLLFVEMNKAVAKAGEGVVSYYWSKPGEDKDVGFLKMSYVKLVEGTDWVVGTGEYINDIDETVSLRKAIIEKDAQELLKLILITIILIIIVLTIICFLVSSYISKPINIISNIIKKYSKGVLSLDDSEESALSDYSKRNDEISHATESIRAFKKYIETKANEVKELSKGNLTIDFHLASQEDQLGNSFQTMGKSLSTMVSNIQNQSSTLTDLTKKLVDITKQLS
ncbi:MAG: cache domain-containing protein, partial [Planctomycetes bacterium]|nr:cache domain-containing protein [Planctomycetota bacterium]